MDHPNAAGTFEVRETTEALDPPAGMDLTFPWTAFHTTTVILLPVGTGVEAWPVTREELRRILEGSSPQDQQA